MAMFQFGGIMCNAVVRFSPRALWRISSQQLLTVSSSVAANPDRVSLNKSEAVSKQQRNSEGSQDERIDKRSLAKESLASVLNENKTTSKTPIKEFSVSEEISSATSVDQLLTIAAKRDISQQTALGIMSIIHDLTNKKEASFKDFERDSRFLELCKLLAGKPETVDEFQQHNPSDLSTIVNCVHEDEAAKLISTLNISQMIKIITALARQKRRSIAVLRSLSFYISRTTEQLDIKQSADLLFAMAVLNFPEEVLLEKISTRLIECIPRHEGSAVIASIFTSLGFLRYRNTELLNLLCRWVEMNPRTLKPQHIASLLLTLATVGHTPSNAAVLHQLIIKPLKETDLTASEVWLDVVWATIVLGLAVPAHVSSVLHPTFICKLSDLGCLTIPRRTKLLNINAAAKLIMPKYAGPFLPEDANHGDFLMERSKEKQIYVSSVLEALANLFPLTTCLNGNVNTKMGFVLDGECYVDDKFNPLPINGSLKKRTNVTRIGVIALDYSDFCRGRNKPIGIYSLMIKLLKSKGYRIVTIPFTEYNPKDKLVTRVKFIEQMIKSIRQPHSSSRPATKQKTD